MLSPDDLAVIAALEQRVLAEDGVPLKLEWGMVREGRAVPFVERAGGPDDTTGQLIAYLGYYGFPGEPDVELIGMVAPEFRRRGIATRLLNQALALSRTDGRRNSLLIAPRTSAAAQALARGRGGELDHSEHSLTLAGDPMAVPEHPETRLRDATETDRPDLIRILTVSFGPPPDGMVKDLHTPHSRTLMIEHAGAIVGTLRADLHDGDGDGGVYGFAIDPEFRGRGIGRDVLGRVCRDLRERGAASVRLQVEVENDNALHLYTSTGFAPVSTEDYFRLPGS